MISSSSSGSVSSRISPTISSEDVLDGDDPDVGLELVDDDRQVTAGRPELLEQFVDGLALHDFPFRPHDLPQVEPLGGDPLPIIEHRQQVFDV